MNDSPVVIKYGGSLLEDAAHQTVFLSQVAKLPKFHRSVVLVHGGGKEITAALKAGGIQTRFVDGRRYTDDATMVVVDRVLAEINVRMVDALKNQGTNAKGFSGKWKQVMLAKPLPELGRVGEPKAVDQDKLKQILQAVDVPVFYSVAVGDDGRSLNINADDFAMAIAIACKAKRLIFLTDTGAILDKSGQTIELVTEKDVNRLIKDGTISGGMAVKAKACLEAVRKGVGRVDICKGIAGLVAATEQSLGGTGFVIQPMGPPPKPAGDDEFKI